MMVLQMIATVFDALVMFCVGLVAATTTERKSIGLSLFMIFIMAFNLLCIWG